MNNLLLILLPILELYYIFLFGWNKLDPVVFNSIDASFLIDFLVVHDLWSNLSGKL